MERTLVLLKPEAVDRGLTGAILERFERAGLRVENCRWVRPTLDQLRTHYGELAQKNASAFQRTVADLEHKPFIALVLRGPNAIAKVRALTGPTDPSVAPAGTIRGDLSSDSIAMADREQRATANLVHAADSVAAAERELAIWFS